MKLRFAPSPTGHLHPGNIRTALVNWLYAKHGGGTFLLRLDDTDKERSKPEYEDAIREDLQWLGLTWDEEARQCDRFDAYATAKQMLIDSGRLYPCYETPEEIEVKRKFQLSRGLPPVYDRSALKLTEQEKQQFKADGRRPHWRFLLNDTPVEWDDEVRGKIHIEARSMSDPVLIREDGVPTYTLSSVVDDLEFGITHILRGEDHVSNTAVQVQVFEALGGKAPGFAHTALIKSKDGELSKRTGGHDIRDLRAKGIEPMAINAYLARIGTSDPVEAIHTLDELAKSFDISKFGRAPATYDPAELERLNPKILGQTSYEEACRRLLPPGGSGSTSSPNAQCPMPSAQFWHAVRHNLTHFNDIHNWWAICEQPLGPIIEDAEYTNIAADLLPEEPWDESTWKTWTTQIKETTGKKGKQLFMPLRLALTAQESGPELKVILPLIGKEKAEKRLKGESA